MQPGDQLLRQLLSDAAGNDGSTIRGSIGCKHSARAEDFNPADLAGALLTPGLRVSFMRTYPFVVHRPQSGRSEAELTCTGCGKIVPVVLWSKGFNRLFFGAIFLGCLAVIVAGVIAAVALAPAWWELSQDDKKMWGLGLLFVGLPTALLTLGYFAYSAYVLAIEPFDRKIAIDTSKWKDFGHTLFAPGK